VDGTVYFVEKDKEMTTEVALERNQNHENDWREKKAETAKPVKKVNRTFTAIQFLNSAEFRENLDMILKISK
jgi:hypothetical protein